MPLLPEEIWDQIFRRLQPTLPNEKWYMYGVQLDHSIPTTLARLCLVCRQFYRIAQPLLYRTVLLEGFNEKGSIDHHGDDERWGLFARTLAHNPMLGRHVRTLSLGNTSIDHNPKVRRWLRTILDSPQLPTALKELFDPLPDADINFTAVALALMPGMQLLDYTLGGNVEPLQDLTAMMRRRHGSDNKEVRNHGENCSMVPGCQREAEGSGTSGDVEYGPSSLKEVRVRAKDGEDEPIIDISELDTVLLQPSLETLRILGANLTRPGTAPVGSSGATSNLRTLQLMEVILDAGAVRNIMSRFGNLRSLSIELGGLDCERQHALWAGDFEWDVDLGEIGQILREKGQSLTELDLHTAKFELAYRGNLGSLRDMKSLLHLRVALLNLAAFDFESPDADMELGDYLPRGLETLYVYYDGFSCNHGVCSRTKHNRINRELAKLISCGRLPNLHQIKVERYYADDPATVEGLIEGWEVHEKLETIEIRYCSSGEWRSILTFEKIAC